MACKKQQDSANTSSISKSQMLKPALSQHADSAQSNWGEQLDTLFPLAPVQEKSAEPAAAAASAAAAAAAQPGRAPAPEESVFDAKAFLRTVPNRPGCYRMYGRNKEVIYVGKAKDLKKRLSSYFVKHDLNRKTQALVSHIRKVEFTVTFSESEALILENELIKKYMPHYNILLRDDKSYPYLHLTSDQEFAGIYFYRGPRRKGGEYFGPFPDATAVKDSLRLLQKIFPIRQCLDGVFAHRSRPCLMAQMGKCLAPCMPMSPEQVAHYQEQVDLLRLFLQGQNQKLLQELVSKMEQHAQNMEFEEAAKLRDQLTALRRVQESNAIVSSIDYPLDVIGFSQMQGQCCIHVLFIRNGRIFGTRSFFPQHVSSMAWEQTESDDKSTDAPADASASAGAAAQSPEGAAALPPYDGIPDSLEQSPEIKLSPLPLSDEGAEFKLNPAVEVLLSFLSQFYLNESHAALIPDEVVVDFEAIKSPESTTTNTHVPSPQATAASASAQLPKSSSTSCLTGAGAVEVGASASAASSAASSSDHMAAPDLHVSHHRGGRQRSLGLQGRPEQLMVGSLEDTEKKIALASQVVSEVKKRKQQKAGDTGEADDAAAKACVDVALEPALDDVSTTTSIFSSSVSTDSAVAAAVAVLVQALKERFGKSVRFVRGLRGSKRRFVELAMTNAQVALQSHLSSYQTAEQRVRSLEQLLGLSNIQRMECYDISHTMGELTVGSCVVFNRAGPDSMRYRRYNISGITPGDDFAAMHQVLTRRFRNPDSAELPDLIFIDGGLGQLHQAESVLTQAFAGAKSPMPQMVAVAKGEGRKEGLETLIRAFSYERINLDLGDPALQLVLHIRDEAHRFAITGHRARRAKARRSSTLEEIAGVGPKRRQALLKHLGGMQEVKRASIAELEKVPGISRDLAQKIYEQLHGA